MARFQLLIRELGKAPRVVPIPQALVVGRSKRADIVIEDEEVGREQFRIGMQGGLVFVEGIGKTNPTTIDGSVVDAGKRVTIAAGATIKIGRAVLQLQPADATESGPARPGSTDATMVAPPPNAPLPAPTAPPLAEQEQTGGFRGPRAATTRGGDSSQGETGNTLNLPGAYRPGQANATPPPAQPPAPPPPTAAPAARPAPTPTSQFGQTMNFGGGGGYRPGQSPTTNGDDAAIPGATIPPNAYRPGGAGKATPGQPSVPPPSPPPPSAPPPAAPAPAPAAVERARTSPPPAATPTPAPAPAKAGDAPAKPRTVLVKPEDMVPASGVASPEAEGKLHQAMPRLFVKGENIRRRVRLMKARTRIGRAETADVLLPNESVSELHAEIEFDGNGFALRDCGSTNGTLVDGEVVRGRSQPIARNSLLGFGNLRGVFLCNSAATAAADRRREERALRLLVAAGRIGKDVARQVLAAVKSDPTQTIAEILLGETPLEPLDWANAITAVNGRVSLLDRLLGLFKKKPKPPAR